MTDEEVLRRAFELACRARAHGNHPFGEVLVNPDGTIALEAENTVVTDGDCTAHAELNLIRIAFRTLGRRFLREPCSPAPSLARCARARRTGQASAGSSMACRPGDLKP